MFLLGWPLEKVRYEPWNPWVPKATFRRDIARGGCIVPGAGVLSMRLEIAFCQSGGTLNILGGGAEARKVDVETRLRPLPQPS